MMNNNITNNNDNIKAITFIISSERYLNNRLTQSAFSWPFTHAAAALPDRSAFRGLSPTRLQRLTIVSVHGFGSFTQGHYVPTSGPIL